MNPKKYIANNVLYSIFLIIALVSTIANCTLDYYGKAQMNEWVLTLAFFIVLLLSNNIRKYANNYSTIILLVVMMCRYCLSPLSYYITGITGLQYLRDTYSLYSRHSLYLMIYELISVIIVINCFLPRWLNCRDYDFSSGSQLNRVGNSIYIVFLVLILIMFPQIFTYIAQFNFESSTGVVIDSSISGMYVIFYRAAIVVVYCILIHWLSVEHHNLIVATIVTAIAIWISAINLTGRISRTLIVVNGITFLLIFARSFSEKKRLILTSGFILVGLIATVGTMVRFSYNSSEGFQASLSNTFNSVFDYGVMCSYFGGLENVNTALAMADRYGEAISLSTLWNDISYSFPFFGSRLADFSNITPVFFNLQYHGILGNTSQIIPYIGQGYVYLGTVLSPVFSCLVVCFAIKCNQKMKKVTNELEYYFYAAGVYYGATYPMYNLNIFCMHLTNLMMPIFIAMMLNKMVFVLKKH